MTHAVKENQRIVEIVATICPINSRPGIMFRQGGRELGEELNHGSNDETVIRRLVEWVNGRVETDIKPADVLGLRIEYWNTRAGVRNARKLVEYVEEIERRGIN